MASLEFDTVKAEKDAALWRYNMEKKLRFGLRFIWFFSALFLLLWSRFPMLIPDTVEVAGDLRRRFVSVFNKPLFIFVVVNIIIVAVYALSSTSQKQSQNKKTTKNDVVVPDNIYNEYVSSCRSIPTSSARAATAPAGDDHSVVEKQIVLVENAVTLVSPTTVDAVIKTETTVKQTKTKPNVASTVVKQSEYRRTRSMVSESRNQQRAPPKEFRRSETDINKNLVVSGTEPPRKSMDEMSSEEFQSIIDSFIAEKKKTLIRENTAHFTRRKEKCMSIVVQN